MPQVLLTMLGSCCDAWAAWRWGGAGAGAASQPAHSTRFSCTLRLYALAECLQADYRLGLTIELSWPGERSLKAALLN